jgi:hypothetical protein
MPRPERFDGLVNGRFDTPWSAHYRDVVDQVAKLGVKEDTVALAWDFPVADGTQPTRSAVAQSDPPGGARIAAQFGYTADNNPFGDPNVTQLFVWHKKNEKDIAQGRATAAPSREEALRQREEMAAEIERAKARRRKREEGGVQPLFRAAAAEGASLGRGAGRCRVCCRSGRG